MKFKFNEKTGNWESSASVQRRVVNIAIDNSCPQQELVRLTSSVVERIESHWPEIQSNLASSLLDTHNESWADPEEGFPELSRDEFLAKLILETIQLYGEESITLYFSDSEIFGGHLVDLLWTTEKMYPASLVG